MKIMTRIFSIALAVGGLMLHMPLHAELLILKQVGGKFVPMDASDKGYIPKIEEILLKYQWPMSAAYALDPVAEKFKIVEETGDLFKPNVPNAEEIFIEQKMRRINDAYRVVFIPTTLYELFVFKILIETYKSSTEFQRVRESVGKSSGISLSDIIGSDQGVAEIHKGISNIYLQNNKFFIGEKIGLSPHDYINQEMVGYLFTHYGDLRESNDSLNLSDKLKSKIADLTSQLIVEIVGLEMQMYNQRSAVYVSSTLLSVIDLLRRESEEKIVNKIITLEYEARTLNKALLIRGTFMIPFEKAAWKEEGEKAVGAEIAGSTIIAREGFEKVYIKEEEILPYSISFGNSLLAGAVNDYNACAYRYLEPYGEPKSLGYALFIDKGDYIKNNNNNLFFIAPLSTLAALFSKGEYFHSRSKAAVRETGIKTRVHGLMIGSEIKDPAGVNRVIRDPLKHASLFSQFIADNGRIIQRGDESKLTEAEKRASQSLIETQKEAAGYYKGIKGIKEIVVPKIERVRSKIEKRKAAATPTPSPEEALQQAQADTARREQIVAMTPLQRAQLQRHLTQENQ